MAIYNLIGGVASSLTITLHGGYGDVITLTNTRNGQKYQNISLEGTTFIENFEIKSGTYKIESKFLTELGLTLPEIEIKRGNDKILAFPDNTIYWFGNGHKENSYLLNKYGQYKTTGWKATSNNVGKEFTKFEDNSVYTSVTSGSTSEYRVLSTNSNLISLSGFTKAKFYGTKPYTSFAISGVYDRSGGKRGRFGFTTDTDKTVLKVKDTVSGITKQVVEVDISSLESGYCGFHAEACYNNTCDIYMYACWLE